MSIPACQGATVTPKVNAKIGLPTQDLNHWASLLVYNSPTGSRTVGVKSGVALGAKVG